MTEVLPYGSWPSPVTTDLVVRSAVSLGEVHVDGDDVWWAELRPKEGGRVVLVRRAADGAVADALPEGFSARTRVHEYGGGAWWLHEGTVFFANWADQRLWRLPAGGVPEALTPEPEEPAGDRYADGRTSPDGRWVVCVRERHRRGQVANEIVVLPASGGEAGVLVSGPDFVSFPRLSPDGRRLAWTSWDHPRMPWDGTELWVADVELVGRSSPAAVAVERVAGGPEESVFQPGWGPGGELFFVSDRSGWWNLYRVPAGAGAGDAEAVAPVEAEVGVPQWVFDQSRWAVLADGRIALAVTRAGVDELAVVEPGTTVRRPVDTPFTSLASLRAWRSKVVLVGASATTEPAVASVDPGTAEVETLRPPRDVGLDPAYVSRPRPFAFPTSGGRTAHAVHYPPTNPDVDGPADQRPPLVVMSHGGPTGAARTVLNLAIQYWTTRGLAVVDVDYGGSTGYGRAYREELKGRWGIVDVDDCVAAARALVEWGEADPERLAIRGGSAGGYTTLAALTFTDVFAAGASHYGVADLEALATDTHKFESRYLDGLVGTYPEERQVYVDRSPIHHTDGLSCPLILFQGLEDQVVPPAQAEAMVEAMRRKGMPFAYLPFEGEQHGFRKAENIALALEAELSFYAQVFGFDLADAIEPVVIENL